MGKRADNRDGSCREILTGRHKGKWRVQFTRRSVLGANERVDRIFTTKTAAKDLLHKLRRGERIADTSLSREISLADWFEWLAENDWPETLASVTIAQRRSRFRNYVAKHLGAKPLSKIDPLQVRAFYKHLREQGATDSLLLSIKADLVRAFNQGVTPYQRIPTTIANPFRLPLPRPQPRSAVALTPEEVKKALAQPALDVSQRAMLGLFLLAGLRLGEVMAITRGQIRLEDDLIVIDRAVRVEYGGKQSVGLPKSKKTRNAVLCRNLKAMLLAHIEGLETDDLLWSSATEKKPRMKKLVYATWRTIVRDAKLPPDMSPHDCRLTHINIIEKLMPKVSQTSLKEHVGHAASGVTEANYTRPITSAQKILRDEVDRVLGERQKRM